MMRALVSAALRGRIVVVGLFAAFLILGMRTAERAPLDVFPEFAPPYVEVQTEAPGLSTAEVESLVTVPVENALAGVSWLETLRSKSVLGLSSVVVIFEEGTDLMRARQAVQERLLTLSGQLPAVAHAPVLLSPLSSLSRLMKIGVKSEVLTQMELSTLARWTIRPRLMSIRGVANVAIWGQRDRQLQVLVDPDRLRAHGVGLDAVVRAASEASSIGAGGFIDMPNQRLSVTHGASVVEIADLAAAPVAFRNGAVESLGALTRVVEGFPPPIGDAIIDDQPGLLLIVEKQPWGNTLEVTRAVEAALEELVPGLKDVTLDPTIFRPATFIELSLRNLQHAMLLGSLLVVAVLIAFLFEWRTAAISLVAIPISLLSAVVILSLLGQSINTMVLAGLVIALGEVVDDAIIDVENIVRRLRENRRLTTPRRAFAVVLDASLEVRSAVVYGSMVVIAVFLPVFLMEGLAGAFFRPLALSYVLAVLGSLVTALILTPALSYLLLVRNAPDGEEPWVARWAGGRYDRMLPAVLAHPRRALVVVVVCLAATVLATPFLGEEFLPHFQERDFLMHWVEKPGTSLDAMRRITVRASRELRAIPGVRNFGSHLGRAEVADEVVGPNFTELWVSVAPEVDYHSTVEQIQEVVAGYPGLYRDVLTYLRERIKEVLTGASATIVVRIYGPDLSVLRAKADEVGKRVAGIAGVANLKVEPQVLVPQVLVRPRPDTAATVGLTAGQLRQAATTLIQGRTVGQVVRDQQSIDIVVVAEPGLRSDLEALRALPIELPGGALAPLGRLASIDIVATPSVIQREGGSRRIDVTCDVKGRDLGSVARDIETAVRSLDWPRGHHGEVLGEYAARARSQHRLFGLGALSLLGIVLLLHADFGSLRLTGLVVVSLTFALVGAIAAAFLSGAVLSLGSLVGLVTVIGIAARNGIMLLSHYRHLELAEGMSFGAELVARGSAERLKPILMTVLATALALLPIILGGTRPGHEIEHPMAVVIFGGLVTSTLMNLLLLPALYLRYGRVERDPTLD